MLPPEPVVAKLAAVTLPPALIFVVVLTLLLYTLPAALKLFTALILSAVTLPVTFNSLVTFPLRLNVFPFNALLATILPNAETSVVATKLPTVAVPVALTLPVNSTPLL